MSSDDAEPRHTSLLRELADGSAGPVMRLIVTLALGAFLAGATLICAYLFAWLNPRWNRNYNNQWGGGGVYPLDELVAWLFVVSGAIFLICAAWLWWKQSKTHALWFALVATLVLFGVTVALCALTEEMLVGDEEVVIAGIILIAFAVAFITWLHCYRVHRRNVRMHHPADGKIDLRCPTCGYRMVGLHEARCPECGSSFTLDDLLAKQRFARTAQATTEPSRQ